MRRIQTISAISFSNTSSGVLNPKFLTIITGYRSSIRGVVSLWECARQLKGVARKHLQRSYHEAIQTTKDNGIRSY